MTGFADWIKSHGISEVECLVPDMAGVARGKIVPAHKFVSIAETRGLRMPESIFVQTVTGDYPEEDVTSVANGDIYLRPDPATLRRVPWYDEPTACVINDCLHVDGRPVEIAPRQVLKRVLALYHDKGWEPVVAPELEFFLVKQNTDTDYPLEPPVGRSGRAESGRPAYGVDAVNEFEGLFDQIYNFCASMRVEVDTLSHEAGNGQMEVNFNHGEALEHIARLTNDITPPREACNTWRALYAGLAQFSDDLVNHIHLENNVLFPQFEAAAQGGCGSSGCGCS